MAKDEVEAEVRVRTGQDLDFFRGDPGTKYTPFILDDSDIDTLNTRKAKAFLDVVEEETMTRERWGGSKFVKNQFRGITDNSFDPKAEPEDDLPIDEVFDLQPMNVFYDLVKPAFEGKTRENIKAFFKRAHFIVNTEKHIYVKLAKSDEVKRFHAVDSYLTNDAGEVLMAHKETRTNPDPAVLRREIEWEQMWSKNLIELVERRPVHNRQPPRWRRLAIQPGTHIINV